ncbi:MAG: cytochrome c3 family protein [Thermoanaerobaculia bacterium]|nr:cytochrome c3 family protein [Thermoanaerobaculia bacterium]
MKWKLSCSLVLAVAALLLAPGPAQAEPDDSVPTMPAELEECATCHEEHVAAFRLNPHSALDTEGYAESYSCASCHGDATQHLEEGGGEGTIFAFGDGELPSTNSGTCLGCHGTAHPQWEASSHARAGYDCTSCHSVHGDVWSLYHAGQPIASELASPRVSDTCYDCHADIFARFEYNERHRLQEGILECTSCHNPHEPSTRWMLGGFKQQACLDCHQDKGGPFIFEHGSVRGEGCVACHDPHGSPNRHQLVFQSVAQQCFSCHAAVPGFHARFTEESQCTNCHSAIHGSNFHPAFLK